MADDFSATTSGGVLPCAAEPFPLRWSDRFEAFSPLDNILKCRYIRLGAAYDGIFGQTERSGKNVSVARHPIPGRIRHRTRPLPNAGLFHAGWARDWPALSPLPPGEGPGVRGGCRGISLQAGRYPPFPHPSPGGRGAFSHSSVKWPHCRTHQPMQIIVRTDKIEPGALVVPAVPRLNVRRRPGRLSPPVGPPPSSDRRSRDEPRPPCVRGSTRAGAALRVGATRCTRRPPWQALHPLRRRRPPMARAGTAGRSSAGRTRTPSMPMLRTRRQTARRCPPRRAAPPRPPAPPRA